MALSFKPVMVEDNGSRKRKELADNAAANNPLKMPETTQKTTTTAAATKTTTTTPARRSGEERAEKQAPVYTGTNVTAAKKKEEPAQNRTEQTSRNTSQLSYNGSTSQATLDFERSIGILPKEEEETESVVRIQESEPVNAAAVPTTVSEATETVISEPRRSGENRAEAQAPIVYTGGETARRATGSRTAAQTKETLTSEEEEPDWMKDLQIANAEDQRRRQAVANANQELAIAAMNLNQQPDQGTIQRLNYEARQQISQPERERRQAVVAQNQQRQAQQQANNPQYLAEEGFSWTGNPSMSADRMKTGGAAEDTGSKNIWDRISAGIASSTNQQQGRINQELTTYGNRNTQGAKTPEEEARDQLANNQQYLAEEGFSWTANPAMNAKREMYASENKMTESNDVLVRQQMINELTTEAFANGADPDDPSVQKRIAEEVDKAIIRNGMEEYRKKYPVTNAPVGGANNTDVEADAIAAGLEPGTKEFNDYVNNYYKVKDNRTGRQKDTDKGYSYSPDNTSSRTTNNRPGAAAEVASWEQNQGWVQQNEKEGGVIDENAKPRPNKNGNATTNAAGNPVTTGSTQSTTQNSTDKSSNPKGTQYLNPSYGQGGKVVKLPYKSGGYTEAELMALGNKAYGTKYGANVYEGYYLAPDGNYYPVDQEKAAYYLRNGYSYEGWEEPMRDYYNTFGTFYGYRPDWKQAGKANNNYSYSPRSYSYSAGGGSSRSSYGRGSTPNNGMYWNGLTSWNA